MVTEGIVLGIELEVRSRSSGVSGTLLIHRGVPSPFGLAGVWFRRGERSSTFTERCGGIFATAASLRDTARRNHSTPRRQSLHQTAWCF